MRAVVEYFRVPMIRGALVSVLLMGMGTILTYAVQIYVSRSLGIQEYGTYAYVLAILNVAALVASFDLGSAALKFAGFYNANRHWHLLNGFVLTSRVLVLSVSTIAAVAGAVIVRLLRPQFDPSLYQALLAGCLLLIPLSLLLLEINLSQAMRRIYEVRIPHMFVRPFTFALVLFIATQMLDAPATAATAILANVSGSVVAVAVSIYLLSRVWPRASRQALPATRAREWLQFSAVMLGSNLLYILLSDQLGIIVVGTLLGPQEAGLLSASSQIATLITFGVLTVNHFASAMISEHQNRRGEAQLRTLVVRLMVLNLALSVPLLVMLLLFGDFILSAFGPEFVLAYPVLVVLAVGHSVNAGWGALWGTLLTMLGFQKESAIIVAIAAGLNVVLTIALVPQLGMIGAAVATAFAIFVRGVLVAVVVRRQLGFWPWTVGRSMVASA